MNSKAKLILMTLLIYGLPVYILSVFPFTRRIYPNFENFQSPLYNFFINGRIGYSSLGIICDVVILYCLYISLFKKNIDLENERVYIIFAGLKKIFKSVFIQGLKNGFTVTKEEKVSLLFYLVKIFWAPLMIIFAIENSAGLMDLLSRNSSWPDFSSANILGFYYPLIISGIFTLDTILFSCGYLFEAKGLKNVVRSVEPTALGWIAALACYGPFFDTFTRIAGGLPQDFADFGNTNLNLFAGFFTIVFFGIYVWASVALGTKASNLTNRGIVSKGPYKYVRHPAYIAKNAGWWLASIPLLNVVGIKAVVGMAIWALVYYIRALTEERHLMQDSDYVEYMKKVKYMFIPGVY